MIASFLALALAPAALAQVSGIDPNNPPYRVQAGHGQTGWNNCSSTASASSKCQDVWINSLNDFCLWAPAKTGTLGALEERVISYCMQANHGTRLLPKGIITSATLIKTPYYIQIKGTLSDQTKIHIKKGDYGGELDPHGFNSYGNPIGGLVFAHDPEESNKLTQVVEWMSFIGNNEFCIRACYNSGPHPFQYCMHIYDQMGCDWVMPNKTPKNVFQSCEGEPDHPAGIYTKPDGTTSTWTQGTKPTPSAYPASPSSNCVTHKSLTYHTYPTKKANAGLEPAATTTASVSSKVKATGSAPSSGKTASKTASKTAGTKTHKATGTGHAKMERERRAVRVEGAGDDL